MTDTLAVHSSEALDTPSAAGLMPALSFQQMAQRYNALVQVTKEMMKEGRDYGKIPGTDKPTLLKPGAEKLCTLFGLRPVFEIVKETEDWEAGLFYYWYKCRLYSGQTLVAEGEGSANSKEKKYRWRTVFDNKATDEEKAVGRLETRSSRNGKPYKVYVIENTEPYDLINTLQKMAQKRSLIAAALIAVNASEFFTQDVEDLVDVEFERVPEEPETLSKERAWAMVLELDKLGFAKAEGWQLAGRVLGREVTGFEQVSEAEALEVWNEAKREAAKRQRKQTPEMATKSQITALAIALKEAGFKTDESGKLAGRDFLAYLAGIETPLESVKDLTKDQAKRVLDQLGTGENGSYRTDQEKVQEAVQAWADRRAEEQYEAQVDEGEFAPEPPEGALA